MSQTIKPIVEAEVIATNKEITSVYLDNWFYDKTGQMHWDKCMSKDVGVKFVEAFAEYGQDEQVIACVTLNYENGIVNDNYTTNAVSPCWSTTPNLATKRQCEYASDNSKGVDAGLFMINTYYQAKRITALGGDHLACTFQDSRNPSDPCNVLKIQWLHDLDNQIEIIKDIYEEQGFEPWVAYKKHVKPYL